MPNGRPILREFGSARRVVGYVGKSLSALLMHNFAAIEEYAQDAGMPQGAWTDVFALGAILHFLLSDKGLPKSLRAVAGKAKADNPQERYGSAIDLAGEIQRYLDGSPVEAYRENILERALRIIVNNKVAFALIAAYLIMRILVFFLLNR